jgi:hypothetical protein
MQMAFDTRTRFYRDGKPSTQRDMKRGERVYADTMLNNGKVFAKTIWIETTAPTGDARGQVLEYDPQTSTMTLRDELSSQPVKFHVDPKVVVRQETQTRSLSDLRPGSLVSLIFDAQGRRGSVREVTLLAQPGTAFSFFGKITYMDLSRRLIAIANDMDNKTYDIYLEALPNSVLRDVRQGSEVGVSAVFDGRHYVARSIELSAAERNPARQ